MSNVEKDNALKYAGFISYSRKDAKWAKKIQRALEQYRLPIKIDENGRPKKQLGKFFRDEDELAGAPSLGATLRGALEDSKALIVICSPNAAGSEWVDQEIRHFKAKRPDGQVFGVIVEGKPDAQDPGKRCFPASLVQKVDADGQLTDEQDEPLAPDATVESFTRVKTRLAAGLVGVGFDELWKREQRRIRNQRLMGLAGVVVIGLGGYLAFDQYLDRAKEAATATLIQRADAQTTEALAALRKGERKRAFVLAASAIPTNIPDDYIDAFADNFAALDEIHNTRVVDLPVNETVFGEFSGDGRFVATTGVALMQGNVPGNPMLLDLSKIDLSRKEGLSVWDAETGALIKRLLAPEDILSSAGNIPIEFSSDNRYLAAGGRKIWKQIEFTGSFYVWSTETWELVLQGEAPAGGLRFDDSSKVLQVELEGKLQYWNIETGSLMSELLSDGCGTRDTLISNGQERFYFANNSVYSYQPCTGMASPGLYDFVPGTGERRKIVDLDLDVQNSISPMMVGSRFIPLRTRDKKISIVDTVSGAISYELDGEVSQLGGMVVLMVDDRPILVSVGVEGEIAYYDLDLDQKVDSPFDHGLTLRADTVISNSDDSIPSGMDGSSQQIFWDRAQVEKWEDLDAIIEAQPKEWQDEIKAKRADFLNLSAADILF